jgi:hypothetical protein
MLETALACAGGLIIGVVVGSALRGPRPPSSHQNSVYRPTPIRRPRNATPVWEDDSRFTHNHPYDNFDETH